MRIINSLKNNSIIKTGAKYSLASTMSAVLSMVVGFLNMRWLGPELLGIWQSLNILVSYMPIVQLGIQSGLNLELPLALGQKDNKKAMGLVAMGLKYAIFIAILLTVLAIIGAIAMIINGLDLKTITGFIAVSVVVITSSFNLHYIATYRSANAFNRLTNIYWLDVIVTIILVYFIYRYLYYGLLLFYVVKDVLRTVFLWYYAPYRHIKPNYSKASFSVLLKRGLFLTFYTEIKGIVESFPRVILLHLGGVLQVGLFSPALTVGTVMNLIPNQISQFLHPQLGYKYGQTKCARDNWPFLRALYIYAPLCILPFAVIGWFVMPLLLEYVFPKYVESLWPIRIMMIGFLFSTTFFGRGFLLTIKAYKQSVFLLALDFVALALLTLLFYNLYPNYLLIDLAAGMTASYLLTYIINIIVVRWTLFQPKYNQPYKK